MIGNNLWPDDIRKLLLHIYPQPAPHFEARIIGSADALRRLAAACLEAADRGQSADPVAVEMMPSDGEHYAITIQARSDRQMDGLSPHYAHWAAH